MLESYGLKRRVVVLLSSVIEVLRILPGTEQIIAVLETVAGSIGGVAVAHAGSQKSLTEEKLAGIVSVIYLLIFLSNFFPVLVPALPQLQHAATLLTAARIGRAFPGSTETPK